MVIPLRSATLNRSRGQTGAGILSSALTSAHPPEGTRCPAPGSPASAGRRRRGRPAARARGDADEAALPARRPSGPVRLGLPLAPGARPADRRLCPDRRVGRLTPVPDRLAVSGGGPP